MAAISAVTPSKPAIGWRSIWYAIVLIFTETYSPGARLKAAEPDQESAPDATLGMGRMESLP